MKWQQFQNFRVLFDLLIDETYFQVIYNSQPNYEGYIVIGAGLPRTGTASMRSALSILLNGPVYHMFEVYQTRHSRDVSRREKSSKLSLLNTKVFALPKDQNEPKIKIF